MKMLVNRITRAALLACGLGMGLGASAQSTWAVLDQNSGNGNTDCVANGSTTYGNSVSCTGSVVSGGSAAGTTATISAWSVDRGVNIWRKASDGAVLTQVANPGAGWVSQSLTEAVAGSSWANAFMSNQGSSGFGAASRTEVIDVSAPDHSFDSISPGNFDMMLVSFNTAVVLDQIGMGWTGKTTSSSKCDISAPINFDVTTCDSDVVVMRWTGSNAALYAADGTGIGSLRNLSSLIGAGGWQLVGSLADMTAGNNRSTGATAAMTSSHWLVSAFNTTMTSGLTACTSAGSGGIVGAATICDSSNDAFKLNYLRTANGGGGGVPEPGSLALLAVAGLGAAGARRRWSKRA